VAERNKGQKYHEFCTIYNKVQYENQKSGWKIGIQKELHKTISQF
jgi:hypothetical protein